MKKALSFILILLVISGCALCFSGCEGNRPTAKFTDYSFDFFDTVTTIIGYEETEADFDANCEKIKNELERYHRLFTIYTRYDGINNLATVNGKSGEPKNKTKVDTEIIDLIKYSKEMHNITGGKVNIAMGSVLSIWHQYRQEGLNNPNEAKLPPIDLLENAAMHTDINSVVVDEKAGTVYLANPEMSLDVGAIAKGYAVEQTAKWMDQNGIVGYLLNVGGNIRIVENSNQDRKWKIGIENPDKDDEQTPYIEYLELDKMSLVTSGSYQRYYVVDGKNYHHIIDPETLMPSERFLSVSVLCNSSADADAFSTALFNMTYEEGKELVEKTSDTEAMWVLPDGEKRYSRGFKSFCVNESELNSK